MLKHLLAGLLLPTATPAHAGFTSWGTVVDEGTLALSPYFYVESDGSFTLQPTFFYGVGKGFDLFAQGNVTFANDSNLGGKGVVKDGPLWLMARYGINDFAIFGVSGGLTNPTDPTQGFIGFELDGVADPNAPFMFTYNVGWRGNVSQAGLGDHSLFVILIPEWQATDRFSLFVEVNPTIDLSPGDLDGDGVLDITGSVNVVPGLTWVADKKGDHAVTFVATVSVAGEDTTVTPGFLYWGEFDLRPKGRR